MIVEIESIHGSDQRMIYYRAQDAYGVWYPYGPVITTDPAFDAESFKATVSDKVSEMLAAAEFDRMLG